MFLFVWAAQVAGAFFQDVSSVWLPAEQQNTLIWLHFQQRSPHQNTLNITDVLRDYGKRSRRGSICWSLGSELRFRRPCQRIRLAGEASRVTDQVIKIIENREVGGLREEEEGCDSRGQSVWEILHSWLAELCDGYHTYRLGSSTQQLRQLTQERPGRWHSTAAINVFHKAMLEFWNMRGHRTVSLTTRTPLYWCVSPPLPVLLSFKSS